MSFAAIVANMIRLASGFYISVHSRNSGHVATAEAGGRYLVINWVIMTGHAGDLIFLLCMRFAVMGLAVLVVCLLHLGMVERSIRLGV